MIRIAVKEDSACLAHICERCIPQPWSQASFESEFDKNSVILCALDGEDIVGFAVGGVSFDEGYIDLIAVDDNHRRRGTGTKLLDRLLTEMKRRSVARVLLDVRCSNSDAISLYERAGFCIICTRRDFYSQPRENAYTMLKEI